MSAKRSKGKSVIYARPMILGTPHSRTVNEHFKLPLSSYAETGMNFFALYIVSSHESKPSALYAGASASKSMILPWRRMSVGSAAFHSSQICGQTEPKAHPPAYGKVFIILILVGKPCHNIKKFLYIWVVPFEPILAYLYAYITSLLLSPSHLRLLSMAHCQSFAVWLLL